MRSSITCLASILDSLLCSSNFLRLSAVPVLEAEEVDVFVLLALAEEDDVEPTDGAPATPMELLTIFGRSIEPVSLNPEPLLGFLFPMTKIN